MKDGILNPTLKIRQTLWSTDAAAVSLYLPCLGSCWLTGEV